MAECLPSMQETLGSTPNTTKAQNIIAVLPKDSVYHEEKGCKAFSPRHSLACAHNTRSLVINWKEFPRAPTRQRELEGIEDQVPLAGSHGLPEQLSYQVP